MTPALEWCRPATPYGVEIRSFHAAVVQRRGEQRCVAPRVREPLEILTCPHPAADQELDVRERTADRVHQPQIRAVPRPHAGEGHTSSRCTHGAVIASACSAIGSA